MLRTLIVLAVALSAAKTSFAHEWTPTYPKFEASFVEGIAVTQMNIFNRREDISFYEIDIYDADWNPIPFATKSKIVEVKYLEQKNIEIYIREKDCDDIEYICSRSKILKKDSAQAGINSRICSRLR